MSFVINDLIRLKSQRRIRKRMNIQSFLNFVIEKIDNHEEDVFKIIIIRYNEE